MSYWLSRAGVVVLLAARECSRLLPTPVQVGGCHMEVIILKLEVSLSFFFPNETFLFEFHFLRYLPQGIHLVCD